MVVLCLCYVFGRKEAYSVPVFIPEKQEEHQAVEQECNSIGSYDRKIVFNNSVNHPEGESGDEHEEHSWGDVIHLFCFPGLQELGHHGGSRANACYQAKDTGPIQI